MSERAVRYKGFLPSTLQDASLDIGPEVSAKRLPVITHRKREIYLILAATLLAFCMGIGGSFHFDDYSLFTDPIVTSPSGGLKVWTILQNRPITYMTFWAN